MKTVSSEDFVIQCQSVIDGQSAGKLDLVAAARAILDLEVTERVHPMIDKIRALAFDVAEDYLEPDLNRANWKTMVETLKAYKIGDWEPTCWILAAMYGKHEAGRLVHSFSVVVRRQNGKTTVETAEEHIGKAVNKVIPKINKDQTDEWYLENFAKQLPESAGGLSLLSCDVQEHLTQQWYSLVG